MKILSLKPGHDGAVAYVEDGKLGFSLEAEKDSFERHAVLSPSTFLQALELMPSSPDVIALSGWHKFIGEPYALQQSIGAGYAGLGELRDLPFQLFGRDVRYFTSSHERSHLYCAVALAPYAPIDQCVILLWEGVIGSFYHWRNGGSNIRRIPVLWQPGARYGALFALADPTFPTTMASPRHEDAGKLMALAAYGNAEQLTNEERSTVERLLRSDSSLYPFRKEAYRESPLFNCEVEAASLKNAARYLSDRLFELFLEAARTSCPHDLPLIISGGCGLNCEWNTRWRNCGLFTSVFVPPVCNDSGSAIGTGVEAASHFGGECALDWSVYCGAPFVMDVVADHSEWQIEPLDAAGVAARLARDEVIAWVQGRYEIGPRALGHRSILASPLNEGNRDRLNAIKRRAHYRPIAPCCLDNELALHFEGQGEDPYMLYFHRVSTAALPAITHVDGTARVQVVKAGDGSTFEGILSACRDVTGFGVLCNTSLNFPGLGFINRLSDLLAYAGVTGIDCAVVEDSVYVRRQDPRAGKSVGTNRQG